jgi:hypothetical protein
VHQPAEWNAGSGQAERQPPAVVRTSGSQVAPLLWDSDAGRCDAARDGAPRAAEPAPGPRRLLFAMDGLGVELLIESAAPTRTVAADGTDEPARCLRGRLLPPIRAAVSLMRDTGAPVPLAVDEAGCFSADGIAPGLLRLRAARAGRRCLDTAWILVD